LISHSWLGGQVNIWDAQTGELQRSISLKGASAGSEISLASDGESVALKVIEGVAIVSLKSGESKILRSEMINTTDSFDRFLSEFSIVRVALSPKNNTLVSFSLHDNLLRFWNLSTWTTNDIIVARHKVTHMTFSQDGNLLGLVGDNWASVQDLSTKKYLISTSPGGDLFHCDFSSDAKYFVAGGKEALFLWDLSTGRFDEKDVRGHNILAVAFSNDSRYLASGGTDEKIRIWDTETWKSMQTLKGHTNTVNSIAFSQNGRLLASGSRDGRVKIWEKKEGK